jgi:hypothetical protein
LRTLKYSFQHKNNVKFTNKNNNNVSDNFSYDIYDSDKSDEFNTNNSFNNNNKKQKNLEKNFENKKNFNNNVNITMTNENGLNTNNNNELIIYNKKIDKQILEKSSLGNKVFEEKDDRRNSSDEETLNCEKTFKNIDNGNISNSSIEKFFI